MRTWAACQSSSNRPTNSPATWVALLSWCHAANTVELDAVAEASPADWASTANGHRELAAKAPLARKKSRFCIFILK
jgi:hypothetical protein